MIITYGVLSILFFQSYHHEHLKYEYSLFKVIRRKPKNTLPEAFILKFEKIQYVALSYLLTTIRTRLSDSITRDISNWKFNLLNIKNLPKSQIKKCFHSLQQFRKVQKWFYFNISSNAASYLGLRPF